MKTKTFRLIAISVISVITLSFAGYIMYSAGVFKKDPKVTLNAPTGFAEDLNVVTDQDYRPYSFMQDGKQSGYDIELIYRVGEKLGRNVKITFRDWNETVAEVNAGTFTADVLMTCDYTDTFIEKDKLDRSAPTSRDDFIAFSKKKISNVNDLYGLKLGIMKNGNVGETVDLFKFKDELLDKTFENNREAMLALDSGKIDVAIMRNSVGNTLIKELKIKGIKSHISLGESFMCYGINDPSLVAKINDALQQVKSSGEFDRLQQKWLTTFVKDYTFTEIVTQNIWMIFAFVILLIVFLLMLLRNADNNNKHQAERVRYTYLVKNLANDFECVDYVHLEGDKLKDEALLLRVSDVLERNIPNWETEKIFSKRLDLLMNSIIIDEDKERFYNSTRRETIIENLKKSKTHFVDFRAKVDGDIQYFQAKFATNEEGEGVKEFIFGIHNIDEETKQKIAIQEQLEKANEAKTSFLFNMSHDIRTPMNAIIGYTDIAKKNMGKDEKVEDCLEKIQLSSNHLLSLINEVLDMSRIEAGKLKTDIEILSVPEEAENLVSICKETTKQKGVDLMLSIKIKNNYVITDKLHVNQILMNILSNSIKYTKPGGLIDFKIEQEENNADGFGVYKFIIKDTGIGMSEEFLTKIFDTFAREENTTVSGIEGTGLGMSIVKRLVDHLGGTIDVKSKVNKGTTVTVVLPLKISQIESSQSNIPEIDIRKKFNGERVLLVEDNELNREICKELLKDINITTEMACDGKEALERLKEKGADHYSVVLMDIQMPRMNGHEATAEIRKLPGFKKLPIVALSANAFEEDKEKSLNAGMNDHIAKPINLEILRKTLSRFIK